MSKQDARLAEEIEKLEGLAFGTKDEVKGDDGSAETTDSERTEATTEGTVKETEATVTSPPETETATETKDWESEYKTLRRNSDHYKYTTRQELANLKERLASVIALNLELKKNSVTTEVDPFKDTFSKEDAETVGEDALLMMKKAATTAANARIKAVEEELRKERELRSAAELRSVQDDRSQATNIFLDKLGAVVPEYSKIDKDPDFAKFIKGDDPVNGGSRLTHFKNAEAAGNVAAVAQYMREFLSTQKVVENLKDKVNPTGSASGSSPLSKGEKIPVSVIDKFYDDIARGKFNGNKTRQRELEAKYDSALASGDVNYMR